MDTRNRITLSEIEEIINIDKIKLIILQFKQNRKKTILTSEIIKKYNGYFISNYDTPASLSYNANFGKLLKKYSHLFNIEEKESKFPIKDDNDKSTSCSKWRILNS